MIDEDIELYSLFRKGDRKAFDTLFLKYYSILCAFGKYYIPIEDAEEVVLDIMTWLWENREFQIIETSLRSYLFMAVRNRCLDLISKNQTKRRCYEHMFAKEMQTSFEDPDFYVVEELMAKIEKAVMRLPDSYRITFEMSRYQDKTYKEIAKELNVSIKLVEYRIQQALRLLRVELKDYLPLITIIFPLFSLRIADSFLSLKIKMQLLIKKVAFLFRG